MHSTPKGWKQTRLEFALSKGRSLDLPDHSGGEYLLETMHSLRPTRNHGMGETPTDWDQIYYYCMATQTEFEPWEAEALHSMCQAYLQGKQAGEDPLAIPPAEREDNDG